jgi:BASS family bile acid:Na+ symporter
MVLVFPFLAIMVSVAAVLYPGLFVPLRPAIVPLLGLVMFAMGTTLTPGNFVAIAARPWVVGFGTMLQYLLMPVIAWSLSQALKLPLALAVGLVLVGSCPGGTASNVICYLAKGDVALSITLTTVSTLLAAVATPILTWVYVGRSVPVPMADMLISIGEIIIAPVALGTGANLWLDTRIEPLKRYLPAVSVIAIVLIIGIIVALNEARLPALTFPVLLAVVLHNLCGLVGGYWLSQLTGLDRATCRTLAIEVGMQNSGLGVALAIKHFSVAAALPGAIFSIWHNVSGALLAAVWSRVRASDGLRA